MTNTSSLHPVPSWARDPCRRFLDDADQLWSLYRLCVSGIHCLPAMPGIIRTQINTPDPSDPENERRLSNSRRVAELAQSELTKDYPLLRGWIATSLWSHLESTISDVILGWLPTHINQIPLTADLFSGIDVKVSKWESLSLEKKHELLIDKVKHDVQFAPRKPGIERFEVEFKRFGLKTYIPPDVRKTTRELCEVRNVWAHRSGVVDERCVAICPWLTPHLGKQIHISDEMLGSYFDATHRYLVCVYCRIAKRYGIDVSDVEPAAPSKETC